MTDQDPLPSQEAQIRELQAQLTAITQERDELFDCLEEAKRMLIGRAADRAAVTQRVERAEAEITRLREVIAIRREQHTEALKGWAEPNGFLLPTEPDADERRRIRDCLHAALTELSMVAAALQPSGEAKPNVEHRCGVRGFAESGDECPACAAAKGEAPR